jgi:hypothetical protein
MPAGHEKAGRNYNTGAFEGLGHVVLMNHQNWQDVV